MSGKHDAINLRVCETLFVVHHVYSVYLISGEYAAIKESQYAAATPD